MEDAGAAESAEDDGEELDGIPKRFKCSCGARFTREDDLLWHRELIHRKART